jgi:hypothetical protein
MRILLMICQDITFENGVCSGGHGLSIGSVGGRSDNTVDTVTFYNNEVKNSVNGKPTRSSHASNLQALTSLEQASASRPPKATPAPSRA